MQDVEVFLASRQAPDRIQHWEIGERIISFCLTASTDPYARGVSEQLSIVPSVVDYSHSVPLGPEGALEHFPETLDSQQQHSTERSILWSKNGGLKS